MRGLFLCVFATAVFAAGVAVSAPTALIGQQDTALPGGVYTSLNVSNAAACAQLCAQDNICMAWTLQPAGACELKAVVPRPVAQAGAVSGLSRRAAAFANVLAAVPSAPEPHVIAASAEPRRPRAAAAFASEPDSSGLLGGPDPEADAAIGAAPVEYSAK